MYLAFNLLFQVGSPGKDELLPTGQGQGLMVSQFLCECHGIMKDEEASSTDTIKYGENFESYWTVSDLKAAIERALSIAVRLHPHCELLFLLENSSNHQAAAPDALMS